MAKEKKVQDTPLEGELITDENQSVTATVTPEYTVVEKESDEVSFLRTIIRMQDMGGWGKHLHGVINERINQLKNVG